MADPTRLTTRLRLILAIVLLADVLDLMDSTITNIAAPTIVRDIGGGESLIKWLGAGYALAMGVLLVVGGRLGDRYGKRRMFLIGIAGFTLASLWCGLSADPAMLIAGRLVQGGFGALLIPQGIGILIGTFSREQLPRVFSAFGPVMGASAVLGPIVAGFIISADIAGLTWRPIFLINIALGTAGFIAALRLLPHDGPASAVPHRRSRLRPARRQHARPDLRADRRLDRGLDGGAGPVPGRRSGAARRIRGAAAPGRRTAHPALPAGQPGLHLRPTARPGVLRRRQRPGLRHLAVLPDRARAQCRPRPRSP